MSATQLSAIALVGIAVLGCAGSTPPDAHPARVASAATADAETEALATHLLFRDLVAYAPRSGTLAYRLDGAQTTVRLSRAGAPPVDLRFCLPCAAKQPRPPAALLARLGGQGFVELARREWLGSEVEVAELGLRLRWLGGVVLVERMGEADRPPEILARAKTDASAPPRSVHALPGVPLLVVGFGPPPVGMRVPPVRMVAYEVIPLGRAAPAIAPSPAIGSPAGFAHALFRQQIIGYEPRSGNVAYALAWHEEGQGDGLELVMGSEQTLPEPLLLAQPGEPLAGVEPRRQALVPRLAGYLALPRFFWPGLPWTHQGPRVGGWLRTAEVTLPGRPFKLRWQDRAFWLVEPGRPARLLQRVKAKRGFEVYPIGYFYAQGVPRIGLAIEQNPGERYGDSNVVQEVFVVPLP